MGILEVRCSQCGTLWAVNPQKVDPETPYQCNACGFVFTVNPEGVPSMQIRHTNGKIYNVKDLDTLIRWVEQKRIPRQCLVREEGEDWTPVMEVPEIAERFAQRDARREVAKRPGDEAAEAPQAITTTPSESDLEALAKAAEAMTEPADNPPEPQASDDEDPAELTAAEDEKENATPSASEFDEPHLSELEAALDQLDGLAIADERTDEPYDNGDEDAFFSDQSSQAFDDDDVLAAQIGATDENDSFDDDLAPKKSKLPLVVGLVALLGGGYYFLAGTPPAPALDANAKSGAGAEVIKRLNLGFAALGSGSKKAQNNALKQIQPMLCEKADAATCATLAHCVKDPEKGTCGVDPAAASYAVLYYLADRLWQEAMRPDSSLQAHVAAVAAGLSKDQETVAGRARVGALTSLWAPAESGPTPPWRDVGDKLLSKGAQIPNAQLLVALQAVDGDQADAAKSLLAAATGGKEKPDNTLLLFAQARMARATVKGGDCGPAADAYGAAKAKELSFATKELSTFLAVGGDIKSAVSFIGQEAAGNPVLLGITQSASLGTPMTDKALQRRFAKINKKNLRKRKKAFRYIMKALGREKNPTAKRGDLLAGVAEIIPSALSEVTEAGWIALSLAQDSQDAAVKKQQAEKSAKRFTQVLETDPNRRDALLGRAAAAALLGSDSNRADFFAWLVTAPSSEAKACVAPSAKK
jgi:hypothetical protein